MAQRAVQRSQTVIDPMFFIPDGVDELVYSEQVIPMDEGLESEVVDDAGEYGEDDGYYDEEYFDDYSDYPDTPDILGVVSQRLRRSPDGTQVVDLVIQVEDVLGASNYEIRVTKAQ